jgi:hypothetical protein
MRVSGLSQLEKGMDSDTVLVLKANIFMKGTGKKGSNTVKAG